MGLFTKKKEEDYEEEDELEEEGDRKIKRKIKDLSPENKKKRKEPPKPWGKKERLIVLTIFVLTVVAAAGLAFAARNKEVLVNLKNFKTPDFTEFSLFNYKTINLDEEL